MRSSSSTYGFYNVLINRLLILFLFALIAYLIFNSKSRIFPPGTPKNETVIIVITPTHKRLERLADMTRLSQTLQLVNNVHWVVVEDGNHTVPAVEKILYRSKIPYIYLATKTAPGYPARGWTHRNLALTYIRENYADDFNAVVYFGDDDNSYDIRLFDDYIRNVKTIGIWAVGLVGGGYLESPKVNKSGNIVGWNAVFAPNRNFATDMAGFGINLKEVKRANASFNEICAKSYKQGPESCFLSQFGYKKEQVQPFGYDREPLEILVWHTKTTKSKVKGPIYGYEVEAP